MRRLWTLSYISWLALNNFAAPRELFLNGLAVPAVAMLGLGLVADYRPEIASSAHIVVGASAMAVAWITVSGVAQSVSADRWFGTSGAVFASPTSLATVLLTRALLHGLAGAVLVLILVPFGLLVFDIPIGEVNWPAIVVAVLVLASTATALGALLGALAPRVRDITGIISIAASALQLLSGGFVPPTSMPGWLADISAFMPLHWSIETMRRGVAGDGISPRLGFEVVCFVVLAVAAYALLHMNVLEGQRSGRLEFV